MMRFARYYTLSFVVAMAAVLAILGFGLVPRDAGANELKLKITNIQARAPMMSGRPGVAYFTIENTGAASDRLVSVSSSKVGRIEMHESRMEEGIMKMRPVAAVDIPAGSTVTFKPGGYHLMLFGVENDAVARGLLPLTFTFEGAGRIATTARIHAFGQDMGGKGMTHDMAPKMDHHGKENHPAP